MPIIKTVQQSEIVWQLPWNRDAQAYGRMLKLVGERDAASFARLKVGVTDYQWVSQISDLVPYAKLDLAIQGRVARQIEDLGATLKGRIDDGIINKLLSTPGEDYIFYSPSQGIPVVAGWGFTSVKKNSGGLDTWRIPFDNRVPVRVAFVRDEEILPNREFFVKNRYANNLHATGKDGFFSFGLLKEGTEFTVVDQKTNQDFSIVVERMREEYLLDVTQAEQRMPIITDYDILVVNQDGEPLPGYQLMVSGFAQEADSDGLIKKQDVPFSDAESKLYVSDSKRSCTYQLSAEAKKNHFRFVVEQQRSTLRVEVHNCNEEVRVALSIPRMENRVYTALPTAKAGVSSTEVIEGLEVGRVVQVSLEDNPSVSGEVVLQQGENLIVLEMQNHFPPPPPPPSRQVRIGIHDFDGSPLRRSRVEVSLRSGHFSLETDDEGDIYLPVAEFSNKERVKIKIIRD